MTEKSEYQSLLLSLLEVNHTPQMHIEKSMQYVKRLEENGLPVIFDRDHLAYILGIRPQELTYLISKPERHYSSFRVKKRRGGYRVIDAPSFLLKCIQRWILDEVLAHVAVSDYAFGFIENRSILDNAARHLNKHCVVGIDIKDFFPSISSDSVFRLFYYCGYTKEVSFYLSRLCTFQEHLPQGAPTSPYISNIVFLKADKRLAGLSKAYGADYSRYADDITFSGKGNLINILQPAEKILAEEGFMLNKRKTRVAFSHQKQEVTGLLVNGDKIRVPKSYKRRLFQEIYYCSKYGVEGHMHYRKTDKAFYKDHLYGKAYYLFMIEPEVGKKALLSLDAIDWAY